MANIWLEKHDADEQEFIWSLESVVGMLNAGELNPVEAVELMREMGREANISVNGYGIIRDEDDIKWNLVTPNQ